MKINNQTKSERSNTVKVDKKNMLSVDMRFQMKKIIDKVKRNHGMF
ncbi:MAG: hypothetical protein JXR69_07725 [Candidatus Delongbacteria bacterium]|nr:hypothetical protein [Candidatus Delongbacteria bacterium]